MIFRIITHLLLYFVLVGSLTLIYYKDIDGTVTGIPITFRVDQLNLKTDKAVYKAGDTVSVFTSHCRNRSYSIDTSWKLVNETVITFPEKTAVATKGCTLDKWIPVGEIPAYSHLGVHHLEAVMAIKVNGIHTVYVNVRSQDFQVE